MRAALGELGLLPLAKACGLLVRKLGLAELYLQTRQGNWKGEESRSDKGLSPMEPKIYLEPFRSTSPGSSEIQWEPHKPL